MVFNQERTYQSWQTPDTDTVNENAVSDDSRKIPQPLTVQEFIKAIDDKELRSYVMELDPLTMRIILLKTFGYQTKDIAGILDISNDTIYQRMKRLRKKLKKFLI